MLFYAGIDPGQTGAIAIVNERQEIADIFDFDINTLEDSLTTYPLSFCFCEKVSAMPGQGVSSTFKFGVDFGIVQGFLYALKIPHQFVRPQEWQKGLFSKTDGDKKKRGLAVVRRMFPESLYFKREKDHDRADAVLIALFCVSKKLSALEIQSCQI